MADEQEFVSGNCGTLYDCGSRGCSTMPCWAYDVAFALAGALLLGLIAYLVTRRKREEGQGGQGGQGGCLLAAGFGLLGAIAGYLIGKWAW